MNDKDRQKIFNSDTFKQLSPEAQMEVRTLIGRKRSITIRELNEMEKNNIELQMESFYRGEPSEKPESINFLELVKEPESRLDRVRRLNPDKWKMWQEIAGMRSLGNTLEEIGKAVGLTRERVRQIEIQMGLPPRGSRAFYGKPKKEPEYSKCKFCKKEFVLKPHKKIRDYCSITCKNGLPMPMRQMTPEQRRKHNTERTKAYYHSHKNDPRQIARLKRYRASQKFKEYHKNYIKKRMQDPEYRKKLYQKSLERLKRLRADPITGEKMRRYQREKYYKWKENKKQKKLEKLIKLRETLIEKGFDPKFLKQI